MARSTFTLARPCAARLATSCLIAAALAAPAAAGGRNHVDMPRHGGATAGTFGDCPLVESDVITASDGQPFDNFGNAVAMDGDLAVIGAWLDDDAGNNAGAAYIYRRLGDGTWTEELKLTGAFAGDFFGWSVDVSGDVVVIGAYLDDESDTSAGAAYVYRYTEIVAGLEDWNLELKLLGENAGDWFGWAVDVDGDDLIVGAPRHDNACPADPACDSGAAYQFQYDGSTWLPVGMPTYGENAGDEHGFAVAIQSPWFAVGEPGFGEENGRAILGGPDTQTVSAPPGAQTGWSLAMDDDVLAIGAPGIEVVAIMNVETGAWVLEQQVGADDFVLGDRFGSAVDVRGGYILVGAFRRDGATQDDGAAYLFGDTGDVVDPWFQTGLLTLETPAASDLLGYSVALGDGLALVGAATRDVAGMNDGAVYEYDIPDCNANGQPDSCDIAQGISEDRNGNGIPDECEQIQPGLIVVDSASPNPTSNGFTWTTAVHELRDALDMAASSGGEITEIWVALGTGPYLPTDDGDRTRSFDIPDGVAVYGGFSGNAGGFETDRSEADPITNETILSGDLLGNDPPLAAGGETDENSYHVVTIGDGINPIMDVLLDGFTITGGNANGAAPDDFGGGALLRNAVAAVTISDCLFTANTALQGGGLYSAQSSPTLTGCQFGSTAQPGDGNSAAIVGGGLVLDGGAAVLTGCTFDENSAQQGGGMISSFGTATLTGCSFSSNSSVIDGGGLLVTLGSATLTGCTFTNNSAGTSGGGLSAGFSAVVLSGCQFGTSGAADDGNSAIASGGAIFLNASSTLTLQDDCLLDENTAADGGGIYASQSSVSITGGSLTDNSAVNTGGAICATISSTLTVDGATLSTNAAGGSGGAVLVNASDGATFTNATFDQNTAIFGGGGLYLDGSTALLTGCSFTDNVTTNGLETGDGGGLYALNASPTLTDCTFDGNTADYHGGGAYIQDSTASLTGSVFTGNSATNVCCGDGQGGGAQVSGGSVTFDDCSFSGNVADSAGGGARIFMATLEVTGGSFADNTITSGDGGGLSTVGGDVTINATAFTGNSTGDGSGGGLSIDDGTLVTVEGCFFQLNSATRGGAVSTINAGGPLLVNCLVTGNLAIGPDELIDGGAGLRLVALGGTTVTNCTIIGNLNGPPPPSPLGTGIPGAGIRVVAGTLTLRNSILFSNVAADVLPLDAQVWVDAGAGIDATYNCLEGFGDEVASGGFGTGNIGGPPQFVDEADLDGPDDILGTTDDGLSIASGSPCIDAADSLAVPAGLVTDFTSFGSEPGDSRFVDDPQTDDTGVPGADPPVVVDMGAYEFQACLGDGNRDGVVDIQDLLALLAAWGSSDPLYDIAPPGGDDTVDIQDLLLLLSNWGACE